MNAWSAFRVIAAIALVPACYAPAFALASRTGPLGILTLVTVILVSATVAFAIAAILVLQHKRSVGDFGARAVEARSALMWFAGSLALALPVVMIVQAGGEAPPDFIRALDIQAAFVLFVICASSQEELIFRGTLLGIFNNALAQGQWLGPVTLSAVLFGLLHLSVGPITAAAATLLGFLAGYARFRTGSLVTAILCHSAFNLASLLVRYI